MLPCVRIRPSGPRMQMPMKRYHVARLQTNLNVSFPHSVTTEQNELRHLREDNAALRSKIRELEAKQKDDECMQNRRSPSPLKTVKDIFPQNDSSPDARRFCFTAPSRWKPAQPTTVGPVEVISPRIVAPYATADDDYFLGYNGTEPDCPFRRCRSSPPNQNELDLTKNHPLPAPPRSCSFTHSVPNTSAVAVQFLPSMERVGSDYCRIRSPTDDDVSNVSSPRSLRINYDVLMHCHPLGEADKTREKTRIVLSAPGSPHSSGNILNAAQATPTVAESLASSPSPDPSSPISLLGRPPVVGKRPVHSDASLAVPHKSSKPAPAGQSLPQRPTASHTNKLAAIIAKQTQQLDRHTAVLKTLAQRSATRMRSCTQIGHAQTALSALTIGLPTCRSPRPHARRRTSLRNRLNSPANDTRSPHSTSEQAADTGPTNMVSPSTHPRNAASTMGTPQRSGGSLQAADNVPTKKVPPSSARLHNPTSTFGTSQPSVGSTFRELRPPATMMESSRRKVVVPVPFRSLAQQHNSSMTHISHGFAATLHQATTLTPRGSSPVWNAATPIFPSSATNGSPLNSCKPKPPAATTNLDKGGKATQQSAPEAGRPRSFHARPRKSLRPSLIPPGIPQNWRELCCEAATGESSKVFLVQKYRWKGPLMVDCRVAWCNPYTNPPTHGEETLSYQLKAQLPANRKDGVKRSRWVAVKQKGFPVRTRPENAWTKWPVFGTLLFRHALAC